MLNKTFPTVFRLLTFAESLTKGCSLFFSWASDAQTESCYARMTPQASNSIVLSIYK